MLLKIANRLPDKYVLHLYPRGCSETVDKYREILKSKVQIHGFVDSDELVKCIWGSDILINIGNTVVNQVPSKLYEYIAYGKPIINFYQNLEDISIAHMEKYSLCLNVPYSDDDEFICNITQWCQRHKDDILTYEEGTAQMPEKRLSSVVERMCGIMGLDR
jgi:hypothetical protein